LVKYGAGILVLGGNNLYTGTTTVQAGTLQAGVATFAFGANSAVTMADVIGALLDITGYNTTIGSLAGGGTTGGNVELGAATLTLGGDGTSTTYSGVINGAGGGLIKTGAGTQVLGGSSSYTGTTVVTGGTLKAGVLNNAFGINSVVTLSNTSGVLLDITGYNTTIGSLSGGGTTGGNVELGGATLTSGLDNTDTSYAGAINGTGGIVKEGSGTLTLGGASSYTGATVVNNGTLKAGVTNVAFGVNSAVTLANTSGVLLDITGYNTAVGSLSGGGTSGGNVELGGATLTFGALNTSATYAGVISGAGGITKEGSGIQTLSGSNTYTGVTMVSGGSLVAGVTGQAFGVKYSAAVVKRGWSIQWIWRGTITVLGRLREEERAAGTLNWEQEC